MGKSLRLIVIVHQTLFKLLVKLLIESLLLLIKGFFQLFDTSIKVCVELLGLLDPLVLAFNHVSFEGGHMLGRTLRHPFRSDLVDFLAHFFGRQIETLLSVLDGVDVSFPPQICLTIVQLGELLDTQTSCIVTAILTTEVFHVRVGPRLQQVLYNGDPLLKYGCT